MTDGMRLSSLTEIFACFLIWSCIFSTLHSTAGVCAVPVSQNYASPRIVRLAGLLGPPLGYEVVKHTSFVYLLVHILLTLSMLVEDG